MEQNFDIRSFLEKIKLPEPDSHKGQNGKLLIIGGSELFHAASRWSLDVASHFVDMLFYSSTPENNELIREAKGKFWDGIVVRRQDLENYIDEADAVLIGPGMMRIPETTTITNELLKNHKDKKIILDAGALQMVDVSLLGKNHIITPHAGEMKLVEEKLGIATLIERGVTILLKGQVDKIMSEDQQLEVVGGNSGMTKGGTGDVLSGLVAALYCQHNGLTSVVVASYINKRTGEVLAEEVGPFFNATDLARRLPEVFWSELKALGKEFA